MKPTSLLLSLGALCLLLSLCAAATSAAADDSPASSAPSPRPMTDPEKAAAAAALLDAFRSSDAPALAAMSLSFDEIKAQCPLLFNAQRFAEAMHAVSPPTSGAPDDMLAKLMGYHPLFMREMEQRLIPEALLTAAQGSLDDCHAIDFSRVKVASVEGADHASPMPGLSDLCPAIFTPLDDLKATLDDGSALALNNPIFLNGAFKALDGVSCTPNPRTNKSP
jgi:hypothetical protein